MVVVSSKGASDNFTREWEWDGFLAGLRGGGGRFGLAADRMLGELIEAVGSGLCKHA